MEYLRQQQEEINRVKQKRQEEERIRREQLIKEQEIADQELEAILKPDDNINEVLQDQDNQNYENTALNEEAANNEPQPQEYFDIIKDNLENQLEVNEQSIGKNSEFQEPEQNDDIQLEGGEGDQEEEQNEEDANEDPQQEFELNPEQVNEYNNEFKEQIPDEEIQQEEFKYDNVGGTTYLNQEEDNNGQPENAEQDDQNFEQTEEVIDINQDQDDQISREDSIDIDQEEQLNIEIESLQYEAKENKDKLKSLKFMMEKLNLLSKATFSKYVDILFSYQAKFNFYFNNPKNIETK